MTAIMNKTLSILSANALFLATMLLVLTAGSFIQYLNLSLGLIATEILLISLPTVALLRAGGIPLKVGLRLYPIDPLTALICLLLGLAVFPFSLVIESVMMQLSGMAPVATPAGALPSSTLDSVLYFIALACSAPVCEEILFRGAIQGAYEKQRPAVFAVVITAVMFIFYHMRVSGLPGLVPVSFVLGYAAWRTRSIYASMLVHFGMNGASAAHTLVALHVNGTGLPVVNLPFALGGLAAAGLLLLALTRRLPAPPAEPPDPAAPRRAWLANYWPLIGGGAVYLGVAALTVASALAPMLHPVTEMSFYLPRIDAPILSKYQVTDRAGEVVGELNCLISPHTSQYDLNCTRTTQAYQAKVGSSFFADAENVTTWKVVWDAKTLEVLAFAFERKTKDGHGYSSVLKDGRLVTTSPEGTDQAEASGTYLLEYEWPWHLYTLKADPSTVLKIPLGYLARWDEAQKKAVPVFKGELIHIYPAEPFELKAGQFNAWKVTYGAQTAWFAKSDMKYPRPIQFDDGQLVYSLAE
jgi:membrane protease YdiL (CAAX protease family)